MFMRFITYKMMPFRVDPDVGVIISVKCIFIYEINVVHPLLSNIIFICFRYFLTSTLHVKIYISPMRKPTDGRHYLLIPDIS